MVKQNSMIICVIAASILAMVLFCVSIRNMNKPPQTNTKEKYIGKPAKDGKNDLCVKKHNDEETLQRSMYKSHLKLD
tara:strand:- start:9526 stop:9756 length:231 start_codon:yes stop_codon:yes gene_type:complete